MKIYEITFITLEEPKDAAVKNELEAAGGRILSISSMGQKTFVYPIEKQKSGYYTTYLFEMEPDKVQAFDRKLGLGEEVLRHLIVSLKPSEVAIKFPTDAQKAAELITKPETELILEPELALEVEPEKSLDKARENEIVAEEIPTESEKVEEVKAETAEKSEEKTEKEVKKADTKTIVKETKKPVEKVTKEETKAVEKTEKPKKAAEPMVKTKPAVEPVDEEERLEALDKKLEELLKD